MIRISLGSLGSGKTANEVREISLNKLKRKTYSNILTKIKHQVNIAPEMIIKKSIVDYKKKRSGETEPVYEFKLNLDFWKSIGEPINVVLDEAHSIVNARRAMSKTNIIVTDWIAMLRRILGSSDSGYGELVLISQLPNRIDIICRDMAVQVRYHICHYIKKCKKCGTMWRENTEMPEGQWSCIKCGYPYIKKFRHEIEILHFRSFNHFNAWKEFKEKSFYKRYLINDIEKYFPLYDTLQWDNLFGDYY